MLLEAGACHCQVLVPHRAAQSLMSSKGSVKVCGVAGGEGTDAFITQSYVAAWWFEGVLQGRAADYDVNNSLAGCSH